VAIFGDALAASVLDLLKLPSEEMVDDILLCSKGELAQLIRVARQAVSDWRDVKVAAAEIRTTGKSN
jgi:hypothetical protein